MANPGSPESMQQITSQQQPMMSNKTMIGMLLVLVIMFAVASFRQQIGSALDFVFQFIAFDGEYPVLTLMIAGTIMITLGTVVRGFLQDPIKMARNQQIQSDFNKEFRQARIENNLFKMKKLQEIQPQITAMSMQASTDQMKVMPITMLFVVPIYAWVWFFLSTGDADNPGKYFCPGNSIFDTWGYVHVQMPWCDIDLNSTLFLNFPVWIFIYTMISLPIGQIENRLIRLYFLKKELRRLDLEVKRAEIE
jgi:uncharacterized membrane protein (DUF106 family)